MNLTPKQLRVLRLVDQCRRTKGFSPTMQELADQLGVSKVTVFEHIEALIAKGALMRDANKARSLTLSPEVALPMMEEDVPSRQIDSDIEERLAFPLVGRIAAGHPVEKFEQHESLALEELFGPRSRSGSRRAGTTFALQVDGMSMREEGILDGDYVLVDQRSTARNGERVVALLPNGETTLKTFYKEADGRIRLQPANPDFEPIIVSDCTIQGVVIGVLRRY